jgi:hypothetical protein
VSNRWLWVLFLAALGSVAVGPETRLHLKTRPVSLIESLSERQPGYQKRQPQSRAHMLLEFSSMPGKQQLEELKSRGATVLSYVPDGGLLVAADEGTSFDGLDVVDAAPLRLENKLSAALASEASAFVVEFHPDVEDNDAYAVLRENNLQPHYHPDLLPHHMLVYGTMEDATRAAEWDEVAYVYPASADLLNGVRVHACAGPVTQFGSVGQYVASVGDGWDGPGLNSADLGYYVQSLASRIPRAQAQPEVLRAFAEWGKYVQVRFMPALSSKSARTLTVLFASGSHGDAYPFDGPGGVLAHTFYPSPPNPESIAGDLHFDDSENWGIGSGVDLFSVVLHETGHALGLGHSDRPGDVMYPYYRQVTGLSADDIAAIRTLYATRSDTSTPSSPDPEPPTTPTTPTSPDPPSNPPADPPSNPPSNPPSKPTSNPSTPTSGSDRVAPSVSIISPAGTTVLTYEASITFRGLAADNVAVAKVTWTDSLGNTGMAAGTASWQAANIPLRVGTNPITIRAYDAAGNSAWRSVTVTRKKR